MTFRATSPEDLPAIADFLRAIYHIGNSHPMLEPAGMHWRYYQPHPLWQGSRSFVLEDNGRIVGHIAAVPSTALAGGQRKTCLHFIDWAADPNSMMAGAGILRKVMKLADWTICVGGSHANRRLLPLLGFKAASDVAVMAKPLRPVIQALTHQYRNWKLPARLVRNSWRSLQGCGGGPWSARRVQPDEIPEAVWIPPSGASTRKIRSAQLARYYLSCPAPSFQLWALSAGGAVRGGALVCMVARQARICDFWTGGVDDRSSAEALWALTSALSGAGWPAEASIWASEPGVRKAAELAGFRHAGSSPVMVSPSAILNSEPLELHMNADDAAYLNAGSSCYLT